MSATDFAGKLGWPSSVPCGSGMVVWKLEPNDDTMIARLIFDGVKLFATVILRYIGREVTMLKAVFNGLTWESDGVIGYATQQFEEIREKFLMHVNGMGGLPCYVEARFIEDSSGSREF